MKRVFVVITFFIATFFQIGCGDGSPVIESLDGTKITVKNFEKSYETAIDTLSRTQNIEKKNILEFISKDAAEVPEQMRPLRDEFQKKTFYDRYRQMLMIKIVADKNGFTKRADIKEILKFQEMQLISNLYIAEQIESKLKITEEEAQAECQELRKRNAEVNALPIDRCLLLARAQIKSRRSVEVYPKVLERVKEGVTIKHNDKFDLEAYLNTKIVLPESEENKSSEGK
ncbi:lipoprotein LipL31 [Leptospira perolatii]|uniref:Lipoprotein LipL31 n=1 Tax=Leptospira perolatii TaxID=2023191 RepID=A0A2M9ZQP9_9LEPT|nr:lipoprotein LipL31 [Leptospira perolatii]PJZ70556.1 lipoprotein LipL31 [Leptospira perolatii]PJZ74392.1 lipoprotein LipL31 [Leptospira perolatii]